MIYNFKEHKRIEKYICKICIEKKIEILIGSDFAENPEKLNYPNVPNKGNKTSIHKKINSLYFFRSLKENKIPIPSWSVKKPLFGNWLIKDTRSYGGIGVRRINEKGKRKKNQYYQKLVEGEHISIQFYCDKKVNKILSICDQIFCKRKDQPFIIETIITRSVNLNIYKKLKEISDLLATKFNLNGINSLDVILDKKLNRLIVIELNARPGLSTNILLKKYKNLYDRDFLSSNFYHDKFFYGTKILYSKKKIIINKKKIEFIKSLSSSSSFSELPIYNETISTNQPICLIHSKSKKKEILRENLKKISYKIYKNLN